MLTHLFENPTILAFLQGLLVIVFLGAAWSTLRERETFEGVVSNYRILPEFAVYPASYIIPGAEIALGLGLILPGSRHYAAIAAVILLALFNLAIVVNLKRGRTEIDCGCFSSALKQHLGIGLVVRNGLLMVAAIWLAWCGAVGSASSPIWFDWFAGYIAALVVALIYLINATLTTLPVQAHAHAQAQATAEDN